MSIFDLILDAVFPYYATDCATKRNQKKILRSRFLRKLNAGLDALTVEQILEY